MVVFVVPVLKERCEDRMQHVVVRARVRLVEELASWKAKKREVHDRGIQ